jgi:hypothetical protein
MPSAECWKERVAEAALFRCQYGKARSRQAAYVTKTAIVMTQALQCAILGFRELMSCRLVLLPQLQNAKH